VAIPDALREADCWWNGTNKRDEEPKWSGTSHSFHSATGNEFNFSWKLFHHWSLIR